MLQLFPVISDRFRDRWCPVTNTKVGGVVIVVCATVGDAAGVLFGQHWCLPAFATCKNDATDHSSAQSSAGQTCPQRKVWPVDVEQPFGSGGLGSFAGSSFTLCQTLLTGSRRCSTHGEGHVCSLKKLLLPAMTRSGASHCFGEWCFRVGQTCGCTRRNE